MTTYVYDLLGCLTYLSTLYVFIYKTKKCKLTRPVKINHMGLKKSPILLSFLYYNLQIIYTNGRKFSTDAEVNELSSAIYRNTILQLQLKI